MFCEMWKQKNKNKNNQENHVLYFTNPHQDSQVIQKFLVA